jgi:hypothetical protein
MLEVAPYSQCVLDTRNPHEQYPKRYKDGFSKLGNVQASIINWENNEHRKGIVINNVDNQLDATITVY